MIQLLAIVISMLLAIPLLTTWMMQSRTIVVAAGGDFQAALNSAQPGDTVELQTGAKFTGNFVLPVKTGAAFITIRSSRCDELSVGQRVSPAQAPLMARLDTPNVGPVVAAPVFSHHYRFECIEFTQGPSVGSYSYNLIELGEGATDGNQKTLDAVPHHFEFDRVIVRARDSNTALQRGIALNSADTSITNSYISDIKWEGKDTQAIGGWNGPGPFQIINNYLEASGENLMFGGGAPAIPNLVPSDVIVRGNYMFKPLSWRIGDPSYAGTPWTVKNLLELKSCRRCVIDNNVLENSWPHAQIGWGVIFNSCTEDSGTWQAVEDVQFTRNRIIRTAEGIDLAGGNKVNTVSTEVRLKRVYVADNDIDSGNFGGAGIQFQLIQGSEDVTVEHNTSKGPNKFLMLDTSGTLLHQRLSLASNLAEHGTYGVFGNGGAFGEAALNKFSSGWVFQRNALYNIKPSGVSPTQYPADNYFPATAAEAQVLLGTDGLPVGVRSGSVTTPSPTPSPSTAPTPSPSPTPVPTPVPTPSVCTMTVNSPVLTQWSSGKLVVTFTGLTGPSTVSATQTSGQVTVSPQSMPVSGSSMIIEFLLQAKKKSSPIFLSGPCGTKTVQVTVQ
jgi:hypothetical protein